MQTRSNHPTATLGNRAAENVVAFRSTSALSQSVRRFSAECSQKLAELKDRVAEKLAEEFSMLSPRFVRQVVSEADALATTTPFPALVLPALAEERVREASTWAARQRTIFDQTRPLVLAFAA